MAIRFNCECGKVLMASDDQAGLEGQCPACEKVITIPETGTLDMAGILDKEESEQSLFGEQIEEEEAMKETPGSIKGLEALERGLESKPENQDERSSSFRSPRVVMLASILVVFLVALVVFMVVLREKETVQEPIIIKKIQPLAGTEEEASAPPVGTKLEEGTSEAEDLPPVASSVTETEPVEQASTAPPAAEEPKAAPEEAGKEAVASIKVETPAVKKGPPSGAYTINLASFKQKQGAEQYVAEMKGKGIEAFDWEIDLPQKGRWYRVSVGSFSTRQEAENYATELREKGISDIFITKVPETS